MTAIDKNGDLVAFETNDRARAKAKLAEFEKTLQHAEQETQRFV